MITNINTAVERVIKDVMMPRLASDDDLYYGCGMRTETILHLEPGKPPTTQTSEEVSVWLALDDEDHRLTTKVSIPLETYDDEKLREILLKVWDAFMIERLETKLR